MEKLLCDAAIENNVTALRGFLRVDPLVLDKAMLNCQDMNPLHIAALFGNVEFVIEVLGVRPHMCLSRDRFERIPLHLAIINGKLDVVKEIVHARPLAARERIHGGGNALHLCVKYNQLEALKFLVETIKDRDFVNRHDDDGMTILHLAICDKQIETIKYLLENNILIVNIKNANGITPLDLIQKDSDSEIAQILESARAGGGSIISPKALYKKRDSLMVVASLIATMAFQATMNPAGGVWQDDKTNGSDSHAAGEAVLAYKDPEAYRNFITRNTIAFVSSLSTILLLISGSPFKNGLFLWVLLVIMWMTITAIVSTYTMAIYMVTPKNSETLSSVNSNTGIVWLGVISLLFLGNTLGLINRWLKRRYGIDLFEKLKRQARPNCRAMKIQQVF